MIKSKQTTEEFLQEMEMGLGSAIAIFNECEINVIKGHPDPGAVSDCINNVRYAYQTLKEFMAASQFPSQGLREEETVGSLISKAIQLHELNPDVVEKELNFPKGVLRKVMDDDYYTNSVPVVLFKNLIVSLHIPFEKIEAAMKLTFKLLVSKETPESIKKKPLGYALWENKEALDKYTNHLRELFKTSTPDGSQGFQWTDDLVKKYAEIYRFSSSRTSIEQFKGNPDWASQEAVNKNYDAAMGEISGSQGLREENDRNWVI